MNKIEISEYIDQIIEDSECSVIEAIKMFVDYELRELFDMGTWDEPKETSLVISYKESSYQIDIEEDGCVESTHEHRIMSWTHTIKEVDYVEEKLTLEEFANLLRDTASFHRSFQRIKNIANRNGIVIVYAASDDLLEFEGILSDEIEIDYDHKGVCKYDLSDAIIDLQKGKYILTAELNSKHSNFVSANFKHESIEMCMRDIDETSVFVVFDCDDIKEKPTLKFDTEVIRKIDSDDLESFISDVYDHNIELMAECEWDWNCWYDLSAKKNALSDYEKKEMLKWTEDGVSDYGTIHLIMNDLVDKDLIEEGDYQVMVVH